MKKSNDEQKIQKAYEIMHNYLISKRWGIIQIGAKEVNKMIVESMKYAEIEAYRKLIEVLPHAPIDPDGVRNSEQRAQHQFREEILKIIDILLSNNNKEHELHLSKNI